MTSRPGPSNSMATDRLLQELADGDQDAFDQLLEGLRGYLHKVIELRMGNELRARLDPSDIVQETHLVAARRIDDFLRRRPTSFKLWLRSTLIEQIVELQRKHIDAARRTVRKEVSLSEVSSLILADRLMGKRPSEVAQQRELIQLTEAALSELKETDREVILLRLLEGLTNVDVATVLGISEETASKRYGRAVIKLREKLSETGAISGL